MLFVVYLYLQCRPMALFIASRFLLFFLQSVLGRTASQRTEHYARCVRRRVTTSPSQWGPADTDANGSATGLTIIGVVPSRRHSLGGASEKELLATLADGRREEEFATPTET